MSSTMHIFVKKNLYYLQLGQSVPLNLLMPRGPRRERRRMPLPIFWRLTGLKPRYVHFRVKVLLFRPGRCHWCDYLCIYMCACTLQLSQWVKYTIVHTDNFEERLALVCRLVDIMVVSPSNCERRKKTLGTWCYEFFLHVHWCFLCVWTCIHCRYCVTWTTLLHFLPSMLPFSLLKCID